VNELQADVRIKPVGCSGYCDQSPLVEVVGRQGPVVALREGASGPRPTASWRGTSTPQGLAGRAKSCDVVDPGLDADRHGVGAGDEVFAGYARSAGSQFLGRRKHVVTEHYGELVSAGYRRLRGRRTGSRL